LAASSQQYITETRRHPRLAAATGEATVAGIDVRRDPARVRDIAGLKATCRKVSSEYWMNANRVGAISKEAAQLKTKVDAVIAVRALAGGSVAAVGADVHGVAR
jgi:hypothetical protein